MAAENDDLPGPETDAAAEATSPVLDKEAFVKAATGAPSESKPKTPPEPKAEAPKAHRHLERFARMALGMGFTQADLDNHSTAEIQAHIDWLEDKRAKANAAKEPAKPAPAVDEDEEYLKQLEANTELDPAYVAYEKRKFARLKAAEAKAARVDELEARDKKRTEQSLQDAADLAFVTLAKDPKAAPLIGTGSSGELDPGELGWRRAIWASANIDLENDSAATVNRKLTEAGKTMLAKKLGGAIVAPPASPPPPTTAIVEVAKKPLPPRGANGKFTEADFERSKTPVPGNRLLDGAPELVGAAAIHQYMREIGDSRASLEYVDRDAAEDLP